MKMKLRRHKVLAVCLATALAVAPLPQSGIGLLPLCGKTVQAANASFTSENGEVTIALTEVKENDYWYEYYLTVTNNSSQSICDWSIGRSNRKIR